MVKEPVESLEERKLRLQFRRDQLLAKKAEEEAKLKQEETKQKDNGDVFRRTFLKYNENEDEKKARLLRSLNALKACNTGKASEFVDMNVGDPLHIDYYKAEADEDGDLDITEAEVIVLSKGKSKKLLSDF